MTVRELIEALKMCPNLDSLVYWSDWLEVDLVTIKDEYDRDDGYSPPVVILDTLDL